jgi:hypothetical protein
MRNFSLENHAKVFLDLFHRLCGFAINQWELMSGQVSLKARVTSAHSYRPNTCWGDASWSYSWVMWVSCTRMLFPKLHRSIRPGMTLTESVMIVTSACAPSPDADCLLNKHVADHPSTTTYSYAPSKSICAATRSCRLCLQATRTIGSSPNLVGGS